MLSLIDFNSLNKKESQLLKKLNICKTRKCAKINKERIKEQPIFEKEQDKKCPQKSSKAFYDCSIDFYEKSKYKKLFVKYVECGKKKCSNEQKTLKKYRNNFFKKY